VELEFSTDQDELRDSIRAVLVKESPVSLARSIVETGRGSDELWATMTELGWPALTIAEEYGGIGLGAIEAGILAEELGRVIAPGPLLATVSQYVPIVNEAATPEQRERFLGAVARGDARGTFAIAEATGSFDPREVTATASPDGDGFVLHGTKRFAIEAAAADVQHLSQRRCWTGTATSSSTRSGHLSAQDDPGGQQYGRRDESGRPVRAVRPRQRQHSVA